MADKSIGTLPMIETLADDASFVAEQQGSAGRITGAQFKSFAKEGVEQYVTAAQEEAQKAMEASEKALEAVASVEGAADEAAAAQAAAEAAEAAKEAAEAAQVAAEAARDQAQAIAGGDFLSLAGGTLTGQLVLPGAPTEDNQAATKKYVDDAVGSGTLLTKADYDPSGEVASAGGIPAYVASNSQAEPELYMTTITYVNSAYSANHTYAEIYASYNAGKICMAKYGNTILILRLISTNYILFANPPSDVGVAYAIKITNANAITYSTDTYLKQSSLSSDVDSDSTTTPANSAAVKTAYDKASENAVSVTEITSASKISEDFADWSSLKLLICKVGRYIYCQCEVKFSSSSALQAPGAGIDFGYCLPKPAFIGGPFTANAISYFGGDINIYARVDATAGDSAELLVTLYGSSTSEVVRFDFSYIAAA